MNGKIHKIIDSSAICIFDDGMTMDLPANFMVAGENFDCSIGDDLIFRNDENHCYCMVVQLQSALVLHFDEDEDNNFQIIHGEIIKKAN